MHKRGTAPTPWLRSLTSHARLALCALALTGPAAGCTSADGDGSGDTDRTATIRGRVVDAAGAPIANVEVRSVSGTTTTSAQGEFETQVPASGAAVLTFHRDGYVRGLERLDLATSAEVPLTVTMVERAPAIAFDSSTGGEVVGLRGAAMNAPANAFRDRDGNPVTGMVEVYLTPLNPSDAAELDAYPGDGLARDASGETIHLETFGVLDVTVMQGDVDLTIRDGMGVQIEVPLPDPLPTEPPESIALWGFDDAAGVWVEEGIAMLDRDAGVYRGTIGHLSPWNCDQPLSATCLEGRALDGDGDPAAGSYIIARGNDYTGASTAVADGEGRFCVPVRKDSSVTVTVHGPNGGQDERTVQSGSEDTAIPPDCGDPRCEDLGDFLMADEGDTDGWSSSCNWGEDAGLSMTVSGYYDGPIAWQGEPWLAACGGLAGGASDSGTVLMFPGTMTESGLSVTLYAEVALGATGDDVPLTVVISEDATNVAVGWYTDTDACTADITANELIGPAVYRIAGTGRCTGPARDLYGARPDLGIEGDIEFSGVVIAGEAATDTILACCYGSTPIPE